MASTIQGALFDPDFNESPRNEIELISTALALIGSAEGLSAAEQRLLPAIRQSPRSASVERIAKRIRSGEDPLGESFSGLRSAQMRRSRGATYTPAEIVAAMMTSAKARGPFDVIIDPGAGSGRFVIEAARVFPATPLVAIEIDPLAAFILRANLAQLAIAERTQVVVGDYREVELPPRGAGRKLFIGNPPYVRHHDIEPVWKNWYAAGAKGLGVNASKLAGLHLHFFVRTLQLAQSGDCGIFITAAEWLDVNYGSALRRLLLDRLGAISIQAIDPKALPFADAFTTGVITTFQIGERPEKILLQRLHSPTALRDPSRGAAIAREALTRESRWSTFFRRRPKPPSGSIELGELCAVHRGQVTGCNAIWIAGKHSVNLPPRFLMRTVTKARDLLDSDGPLTTKSQLRTVIDLPVDLEVLDPAAREAVEKFLAWAKRLGAHRNYIAQHRKAWWAVQLFEPAPIISTYMARRPPVFVRNLCQARHLNIAHGLYPREPMSDQLLDALSSWLQQNVHLSYGRTYAGGLTKFEPRELERVPIPRLDNLPL